MGEPVEVPAAPLSTHLSAYVTGEAVEDAPSAELQPTCEVWLEYPASNLASAPK